MWSGPVWVSNIFGPEPWHPYDGKDVPGWGSEWQADMQHENPLEQREKTHFTFQCQSVVGYWFALG